MNDCGHEIRVFIEIIRSRPKHSNTQTHTHRLSQTQLIKLIKFTADTF